MSFPEAMEEGKWISALKEVTFSLEADLVGKKGRVSISFVLQTSGPFLASHLEAKGSLELT